MSVSQTLDRVPTGRRASRAAFLRGLIVPLSLVMVTASIVLAAFVSWAMWQVMPYGLPTPLESHMRLGAAAALIVLIASVLRGQHRVAFYTDGENTVRSSAQIWNLSIFVLFAMMFLTRRIDDLSRGVFVLFYLSGFAALWGARRLAGELVVLASRRGLLVAPRIMIVGTEAGIRGFLQRHQPWNAGLQVVGTVSVAPVGAGAPRQDVSEFHRAIELARTLDIDDVYVAVPWSETETIDLCVEAFLNTPVAIHLAPERVLDRFDQVAIARVGTMASLELTRPMSPEAVLLKRAIDVAAAAAGLIALLPLFSAVALLIKLDSPGPVLFLQSRYGFNQRRFSIFKFRTMTTFADAGSVPQAGRDDPRITRMGRWLRRTNIDELPQLLNVLIGQMSLVGPRPHAVPHNRAFERRIALYARRHNVRPGITGWAQVHGLRGETDTDEKMARRVEHDLFYIDNWSLLLDLRIILKTLFSPAAYRNAY